MLPKVNREDALNGNNCSNANAETTTGAGGGTNKKVLRILSASPHGPGDNFNGRAMFFSKGSRRPISTKSAHLTPIPLEPAFLPQTATPYSPAPQRRPYLPYSASSPTLLRAKQSGQQKLLSGSSVRWNGDLSGGKTENTLNRARAQSHRSTSMTRAGVRGMPGDSVSKSMPYLVPQTAHSKTPSSSSTVLKPRTSDQQQQTGDDTTKHTDLQTSAIQLVGGVVLVGNGKPGAVLNGTTSGPMASSLVKDRVQVCRTKEEREKSPDSIRLDKRGVRVFPDIGGGESTSLKLLSLQHNLITRLENVPLLSQLVVLDLYDNRVERICGLQGLPSLRVLLLGKNRIKRIEGLDSLKRLEILDLHGNQLRYVDNIGALCALRVLNLAGNLLRNIRNMGPYGMSSLTELNLKRNRIKNLDGLQKVPHLKKLLLANNDLQNVGSLAPLRRLAYLNELVIEPNPMVGTAGTEYQSQILTLFPNLGSLDRTAITDAMRQEAKLWHRKKLEEEERKKLEEERLRQEMAQTVGPPGSREQVIYQARRRWESLRNFVKSSNTGPPNDISTSTRKTAIKSMKKAVTVVAEAKKKQAEILYPPATLDLEEFPDGHEKLDQMESLLSSKSQINITPQEKKRSLEDSASKVDKEKSHVTPNSKLSQLRQMACRDNLTNKIEAESSDKVKMGNNTPLADMSPENTKSLHDVTSTVLEGQELSEDRVGSNCSARSNSSSKVAVVRPLVHRSPAFQRKSSSPELEMSEECSLPVSKESIQVIPNSEIACAIYSETTPLVNVTLSNEHQETLQTSQKSSETFIPGQTIDHEDNSFPTPQQCDSSSFQSESARVKSKLLKHLRSISLDSCPHPFLRPGDPKTGDGSSLNSASPMIPSDDDNDDGEEDDDNDNEVVQDYDCDDEDAYSIATSTGTSMTSGSTPRRSSTVMATTNRLLKNGVLRKQSFPRTRSQRIKMRDRAAKLFGSTSDLSPRSASGSATSKRVGSGTGTRTVDSNNVTCGRPTIYGRILRRCDSAASLTTSGVLSSPSSTPGNIPANCIKLNGNPGETAENQGPSPYRKQGMDFLVEIEGKMLNVFGLVGLKHGLTAFASNVTCHVITAKFHYISYDSIIPFFGKLRQVYPSLEHFHFRANNICTLSQLDALSDLQGLTSLFIAKEGNPIVTHEAWVHYASYRLSHWGLQVINGKEISSEYRGGASPAAQAKAFESLGFLALSCLPQTALTPLAKRLHMLHCFCCCSPSTSSDESNRRLANTANRLLQSPSQPDHNSNTNFCTAWDDDPVLLDVIGKEALVYCPPALPPELVENGDPSTTAKSVESATPNRPPATLPSPSVFEKRRAETLGNLVHSGVEIVEKVDMLEKVWPTLMTEVIQEMLMDFRFMDSYMKKELKKCQDITLIQNQQHGHIHGANKKLRH